jgi:predicted nucleotidyltransferase
VKEALRERIGPDFRLILFGSYARGDAGPDSDVDLLIILPDAANTFSVREAARDTVYGFALESQYVFSAMVVSESQAREYSGFMAFAAVEREGVPI